jgi:hypothetical protein
LPLDFTGCTLIASFSTLLRDRRYEIPTQIEEPPTTGSISLVIPAELTRALPTGRYRWDIVITMANGDGWRALEGKLHLVGGTTQRTVHPGEFTGVQKENNA